VEAGSNTSTVTLRVVGGNEKGSLESETVKYGQESHGTRTRKLLRWRGPAAIVNDSVITMTASLQLKKKNAGRESQGACSQDELIGGKPPVVKQH
jgi:hypothetical protein